VCDSGRRPAPDDSAMVSASHRTYSHLMLAARYACSQPQTVWLYGCVSCHFMCAWIEWWSLVLSVLSKLIACVCAGRIV